MMDMTDPLEADRARLRWVLAVTTEDGEVRGDDS
jgi:hypothetical protein